MDKLVIDSKDFLHASRHVAKDDSDLPSGLAAPARRALAQAGYRRIEQFTELTEAEVGELHGMGPKSLELIRLALAAKGLSFSN